MSLENKVVLITGATGRLGRVATKKIAMLGARLALLGRNEASLSALKDELGLNPDRVMTFRADLIDPTEVELASKAVEGKFGSLDVILHLVGGWVGGKAITDLDPKDVANMLDQHLWTTLHVARSFLPLLVANHWGRFLVVSAPSASSPGPKGAPYAVGKAAQQALVMTLAQEMRGTGVTANVLYVKAIDADHSRVVDPSPKNANWATPEEIVTAMLYLCSDDAKLVSGAVLPLYGGG